MAQLMGCIIVARIIRFVSGTGHVSVRNERKRLERNECLVNNILQPCWIFCISFLFETSEKKLITDALNKNQFLKRLEPHQIRDMVECMYERSFQQGSYVIRQGEPGNHIFVLKGEYCLLMQCTSARNRKVI